VAHDFTYCPFGIDSATRTPLLSITNERPTKKRLKRPYVKDIEEIFDLFLKSTHSSAPPSLNEINEVLLIE
jgi:hypothetical protein